MHKRCIAGILLGIGMAVDANVIIFERFREELHQAGTTILLVEQNAQVALSIADRAYVLETGTISMSGDAKALLSDPRVQKAYLGG